MNVDERIEKYIRDDRECLNRVKRYFEEKLTLEKAIEYASRAIDPTNHNKMFSHQRRIGKKVVEEGYTRLNYRIKDFSRCKNFEDIIRITDEIKNTTHKLGDLWSYDTALRIGFHLKIYPTDVYIQAGVVKGYEKIMNKKPKVRKIALCEFPILQELEAYEVENFLCHLGSKMSKSAGVIEITHREN